MIYLFTESYPFGYSSETFLETEIIYLCNAFDKVVIIPFKDTSKSHGKICRDVPNNCEVLKPIARNKFYQYLHLVSFKTFSLFFNDFITNKVYKNRKRLKAWLIAYVVTNNYMQSKQIRCLISNMSSSNVVYSYWGKDTCYIFPFLYGKCKLVSRFHSEGDLWGVPSDNYIPIREKVVKSLNLAVFISQKGEKYFLTKYNCNTLVSRLGTKNTGYVSRKSTDGVIRIISCSAVIPLKRVDLIYKSLQLITDKKIEWTHIGSGLDFENLKQLVQKTSSNIKVNLLGKLKNSDVLEYYKTHQIDVFINVSTTEGIPVSIMEALSFDVPIIATNVGGNSEIVTEKSGILISANPSCAEINNAILNIVNRSFNARKVWEDMYNAELNYIEFANVLKSI